jgi:hypothetical protein
MIVDVSVTSNIETAFAYKKVWNEYIETYLTTVSDYTVGVFHTSALWVSSETSDALLSSTYLTLTIVIVLAFLSMVAFTRHIGLSLIVVTSTIGIVSGLAFFMLYPMGWGFGPIEVIALIVFVGYALDYSLHIAHKYGSPEALVDDLMDDRLEDLDPETKTVRYERVRYALKSIGGAALGSALTTMGASSFLLMCTLTLFLKIGIVVIAITLISILSALVPLPAALLIFGPTQLDNGFLRDPVRYSIQAWSWFRQHFWRSRRKKSSRRSREASGRKRPSNGSSGSSGPSTGNSAGSASNSAAGEQKGGILAAGLAAGDQQSGSPAGERRSGSPAGDIITVSSASTRASTDGDDVQRPSRRQGPAGQAAAGSAGVSHRGRLEEQAIEDSLDFDMKEARELTINVQPASSALDPIFEMSPKHGSSISNWSSVLDPSGPLRPGLHQGTSLA